MVHEQRPHAPDRPHHDGGRDHDIPDPAGNLIRPFGITAGPDGNVWFTDFRSNVVGRITPAGAITTFTDPAGNLDGLGEIALGPDGALWFTSTNTNRIGRVTTAGDITSFVDPQNAVDAPLGIAAGPDGNLWFTSMNNARIGRITTGGDITTYTDPAGNVAIPRGITAGPGTDVWFASTNSDRVGRILTTGPAPAPPQPVVVAPALYGLSSYTARVSQSPQPGGALASPTNWNRAFSATRRDAALRTSAWSRRRTPRSRQAQSVTRRSARVATPWPVRLPLEPVADLGAPVLAAEAVDADRPEERARLRIDDHERRVGARLPRARRALDELDRVGARAGRGTRGPAWDLGVLARLGDRVDVAGHRGTQHDLVVAETGDGQVHPARVSERCGAGLRITTAP